MKLAVIGLGTISSHYIEGIFNSSNFNDVIVCDVNKNAASIKKFTKYKFYDDLDELLNKEKPDYCLVSTPPSSHFELVKKCLNANSNVMVEKPAFLSMKEFDEALSLASSKNLKLITMFHWQSGEEVRYFLNHFDVSKIRSIHTTVYDPYSKDEANINQDKIKLEGTFIDSGVNILSFYHLLGDFKNAKVNKKEFKKARNVNQPIVSHVEFSFSNISATIDIDWTKHTDLKITEIDYDGAKLVINHSTQTIMYKDEIIRLDSMVRLTRHYYNMLTSFKGIDNSQESKEIHEALFLINNF